MPQWNLLAARTTLLAFQRQLDHLSVVPRLSFPEHLVAVHLDLVEASVRRVLELDPVRPYVVDVPEEEADVRDSVINSRGVGTPGREEEEERGKSAWCCFWPWRCSAFGTRA